MDEIEKIRRRITKDKNQRGFLFFTNCFLGVLIIILSSLIYMKKDPQGSFIKKIFNENVSFEKFNEGVNKLFQTLIVYKGNEVNEVDSKVNYIEHGNNYYSTSSNNVPSLNDGTIIFIGQENEEVSLIIQYDNGVIASYFDLYDIRYATFDEVNRNEILGTYIENFRVLFKKGNKLLTLQDAQ